MSVGGPAPSLPDSGWKVLAEDALKRWLASSPPFTLAGAVLEWIETRKLTGPSTGAVHVRDTRYRDTIPGTRLQAEYELIEFEFLLVVREFR